MKKALIITVVCLGLLAGVIMLLHYVVDNSHPIPSGNPSSTANVYRDAWLNQRGSGMFFGTGPDPSNALNVSGLATQFSDNASLWMKIITPGSFNSLTILFKVEKAQMSPQGGIISKQYITEFSIPTNPQDNTARFSMPAFSIGPGEYILSAYRTDGSLCISRMMKYLAPGEQANPNYSGGMW